MINFKNFTGWVVTYKTYNSNSYRYDNWLITANTYEDSINKAKNAIEEYYARDILIYYVVDGIAEQLIRF